MTVGVRRTVRLWRRVFFTKMLSHCLIILTSRTCTVIIIALSLTLNTTAVNALETSLNRVPVVGDVNSSNQVPDGGDSIPVPERRTWPVPFANSNNQNHNDNVSSSAKNGHPGRFKRYTNRFNHLIRCPSSIYLNPGWLMLKSLYRNENLRVVCPDQPLNVINATRGALTVELLIQQQSDMPQGLLLVATGQGWADSAPMLVDEPKLGGSVRLTTQGGGLVYDLPQAGCPLDQAWFLCHYVLKPADDLSADNATQPPQSSSSPLYNCCTASPVHAINEDVEQSRIVGSDSNRLATSHWEEVTMECRKKGMPADRQWVWQFRGVDGRWKPIKVENPMLKLSPCNFEESKSTWKEKLEPDSFLCTGDIRCALARYVSNHEYQDREGAVTDVLMEHTFGKRKCKALGSSSHYPYYNGHPSEHQQFWPGGLWMQVAWCLAIVTLTR